MDDRDWLAQCFENNRAHLQAVAYRLLGSTSEADDAVQEAWVRALMVYGSIDETAITYVKHLAEGITPSFLLATIRERTRRSLTKKRDTVLW